MATDVGICNMALRHLGNTKEIANLETEKSAEAAACRRFFEMARDATLRDFDWGFATKIDNLALIEANPNDEWDFSYRVPSDSLKIRRILSGIRNDTRDSRVSFKEAQDSSGLLIFTDQEDAQAEYTIIADDALRYPADFAITLSYRLALYIAPSVSSGDPFKMREYCAKLYQYEGSKAMSSALSSQQVDQDPDSEFIRSRT